MFGQLPFPRFSDPLTGSGKFSEKLKANSKRYKVLLGFYQAFATRGKLRSAT